jgi:hypothetical protein
MKENRRYNRMESKTDHFYINDYGTMGLSKNTIYGYIKCKLVHAENFSVIIPDQVYFNWNGSLRWLQPFIFLPCRLANFDDYTLCDILFDISCGYTSRARFKSSDFIRSFDDGSQLFKCELLMPDDAGEYAIGIAEKDANWNFSVELFHHTKPEIIQLITDSEKLLGSKWNIQGSRELKNSEHVYFTPLHEIKVNNDLERIAMSHEEQIKLIRDNFNPPSILLPGWEEKYKNDFLLMKVYREDAENRTATLSYMVPAHYISPHHILKHSPHGEPVYYEISTPFIHRVQIGKGESLAFKGKLILEHEGIINHNFIIIGDATRLDGLQAPYDEENTVHIFKIEFLEGENILDFWFSNANQNIFGGRNCAVV